MGFKKKLITLITTVQLIFFTIIFASTAYAELRLDSVYPTMGALNQDLEVTLSGTGFDATTKILTYLDSANKRAIIGSVDTPDKAVDVTVLGNFAYVAGGGSLQIIAIDNPSALAIINSVDIPGDANGVIVSGKYAYVAAGDRGLQVIDISDPVNPKIIGSTDTPGAARGLAVAGSFVVMADGDSGLQIIDISIPTTPQVMGSIDTIDYAHDVEVVGNYAFVADGFSGLQVIDFSQPTSPKLIGGVDTWHIANDIFISDSYAYIADYHGGLQIIDISLPDNPEIVGTIGTTDRALGISVSGNFAYMADGDRVQIIDISNPQNPRVHGSVDTPGDAHSVAILGTFAYVAGYESGLQVIDTSIPTGPQIVGSVGTPSNPRDIAISGNYAFVAVEENGVLVIDISNSSAPRIIGSIDTPGAARGIDVNGSYAYVADNDSGLQVIDVSTPRNPRIIGFVDTLGLAQDVAVTGSYAYVADYHYDLQVIDISSPENPKIVGSEALDGLATEIVVSDNYAYVACDSGGPHVVDVSIPSAPQRISTITGYESYSIAVSADYAYVAGFNVGPGGVYESGFRVVDISTPSTPQTISSLDMPDYPQRVVVSGNYAYVNNGYGGIHVIEVSVPTSPQIISTILTPGSGYDVTVSGNFAYVSDSQSGLIIVALPIELNPTPFNETNLFLTLPSPILAGSYTLRAFNDIESSELAGAVSFTDNLQILNSKAIVVAGGGPNAPGEIWEETKLSANKAYDILIHEGYDHGSIWYLSMETGNPYVDGPSLLYALDDAINSWSKDASELVIFFVDHGLQDSFIIYADGQYSQQLIVDELDDWLDNLQENMVGPLTFIYDACHSGTFATKLIPPPGKDRIVISGASDEPAYFRGEDSFSFQFWEHILLKEGNIGFAFSRARDIMQGYQSALLNANGNHLTNETEDITTANGIIIRRGQPIFLKPAPTIGSVAKAQTLNGPSSVVIWVSHVIEAESVWAQIIPPDINPDVDGVPITDLPAIELQDTDDNGTYDGTYSGFTIEGTYTIIINAQTTQEIYSYVQGAMVTQIIPSSPVYTSVTQMNGTHNISVDDFEDDDTYSQAKVITLNDLDVQPHNFHDLGDVDWVKFYGLSGQTYTIKAGNVNVICDVVIELFDSNGTTRLVGSWNEAGDGENEILEWTCTRDDVYYVKLSNANATFGENCKYDLKLYRPIGPLSGFIKGTAKDALTGQELADVKISTDAGVSGLSLPGGGYVIVHPPGTYNLTAQKAGYILKNITNVTVREGDLTPLAIPLMPPITSVTISGPTQVNESSSAQYTLTSYYDNGSSSNVTNSAGWSENSVYAGISSSGLLTTFAVSSDQSCTINASYSGKSDTYLVTIKTGSIEIEEFVTRFYQLCLDRNPDDAGLEGWAAALADGSLTGSDVAYGFVYSQEFLNQSTTNEEYLQVLYEAFFNRQPDAAGWNGWLDAMQHGVSREDVLNGFIYALEFAELCEEYGILAYEGYITKAQREAVEAFVTRFYQLCLDRNPDAAGLDGWTDNLLDQIQTGADVANGFIYSQEFIAKNTTNKEYLNILYKAFFDRDPDPAGWDVWIAELNGGRDRGEVLNGFIYSQEFANLCSEYGIKAF